MPEPAGRTRALEAPAPGAPARIRLENLGALWFQVTGLLCNLECTHCLVDSSPRNRELDFLDRGTVRAVLAEAGALGVKEVYFTGGEPFLHKQMTGILADALAVAPATVLTNGTLITSRLAGELGEIAAGARYSLEIRVSLDHPDPVENDRVRGTGSHAKALRAVLRLQEAGLLPIVTATEYLLPPGFGRTGPSVYDRFRSMLLAAGVRRPRLKLLPVFHTGKLEDPRSGGAVTQAMMAGIAPSFLQCSRTRVVAADGIYACPILVGKRVAHLGVGSLAAARPEVALAHHACRTCYETGMSCGNA